MNVTCRQSAIVSIFATHTASQLLVRNHFNCTHICTWPTATTAPKTAMWVIYNGEILSEINISILSRLYYDKIPWKCENKMRMVKTHLAIYIWLYSEDIFFSLDLEKFQNSLFRDPSYDCFERLSSNRLGSGQYSEKWKSTVCHMYRYHDLSL